MNAQTNNTQAASNNSPSAVRASYIFKWIRTPAEIDEALRFRFKIYFQEMGRDKKYADLDKGILRDPLDSWAHHLSVRCASTGEIVGITRVHFSNEGELPENELYKYSEFGGTGPKALVSKMMIDKDHRGTKIFKELCVELYRKTLAKSCSYVFIATADHLVPLFKRVGFRQHQARTTWADYGSSNPMVFDCRDIRFLKEIQSPLYVTGFAHKSAARKTKKFTLEALYQWMGGIQGVPHLAR